MNQYSRLDNLIVLAIRNCKAPLYESGVNDEAKRIALLTGREVFRIIDGRLSALKRIGVIRFDKRNKGRSRWVEA